jgi:hypothetical protein
MKLNKMIIKKIKKNKIVNINKGIIEKQCNRKAIEINL